jgi:hypothetical protein
VVRELERMLVLVNVVRIEAPLLGIVPMRRGQ